MLDDLLTLLKNNITYVILAIYVVLKLYYKLSEEEFISKLESVTSSEHLEAILSDAKGKKGYVLIDFYATWCPPCKKAAPIFEAMSAEYPSVRFMKCDVDQCKAVAQASEVKSMPTFILYHTGKEVERQSGFSKEAVAKMLEKHKAQRVTVDTKKSD